MLPTLCHSEQPDSDSDSGTIDPNVPMPTDVFDALPVEQKHRFYRDVEITEPMLEAYAAIDVELDGLAEIRWPEGFPKWSADDKTVRRRTDAELFEGDLSLYGLDDGEFDASGDVYGTVAAKLRAMAKQLSEAADRVEGARGWGDGS